ncbi:MAG: hypothetical protein PUD79_03315 [Prevotellaceae bacterium]|nr:hypothetical protein [Prevotellaceae bacterium]
MKKKYFTLSCIAAVAIATFVGTKTLKSNAHEENALILSNVEALSIGETKWGYAVTHEKYIDPVTQNPTNKCMAICWQMENGSCSEAHKHGAIECCSINC